MSGDPVSPPDPPKLWKIEYLVHVSGWEREIVADIVEASTMDAAKAAVVEQAFVRKRELEAASGGPARVFFWDGALVGYAR